MDLKGEDKEKQQDEDFGPEPTRVLPQYLAAAAASLSLMVSGTVLGWTSPTLPKLMGDNSSLPVAPDEASWIGSLVALGAVVGPFPAGLCSDLVGRKRALLAVAVPFLVSWCLLAAASSVVFLYIGRLLAGLANGWCMTVLPMYVGEIATPDARGALGVLGQILITLGFVYVYSFGPFVSYQWLCILCGVVPVVFFVAVLFIPESPYYEMGKNHYKAASKSLRKLRGKSSEGVKDELNGIKYAVEESQRNTGSWAEMLSKQANRKALFLMCMLMAVQQASGINVVLFYSEEIFARAGSSLSPSLATILIGIVMFLVSFLAPYLIESLGRRMVLMVSSVGMLVSLVGFPASSAEERAARTVVVKNSSTCIMMLLRTWAQQVEDTGCWWSPRPMMLQTILGACFLLETLKVNTSSIGWLPLASIIGYICLYSIGLGPVPWAMIGEMFAPSIRSKGAAFTASFSWLLAFFMTKVFNELSAALGIYTGFWIMAFCCGLGAVLVFALLPETKGKTLQEIQDILNKK